MESSKPQKKILIIEDDPSLQGAYKKALEKFGYLTIFSSSGSEGLKIATTHNPDLILLDLMLPFGMNGFDVLEALKNDEKLSKIPVFVLTNLDSEEKSAMDIGAEKYFIKTNLSINELTSEIDKVLNLSKASQ